MITGIFFCNIAQINIINWQGIVNYQANKIDAHYLCQSEINDKRIICLLLVCIVLIPSYVACKFFLLLPIESSFDLSDDIQFWQKKKSLMLQPETLECIIYSKADDGNKCNVPEK